MVRQIINIKEELCNGCGLCVSACHESAIGLVDGKAKLLRDDYCDGLGNCLPVCPTGAITFIEREALEYNEAEVKRNMEKEQEERDEAGRADTTSKAQAPAAHPAHQGGCPGSRMQTIKREESSAVSKQEQKETVIPSQLRQWPVQIQLVPVNAPYFGGADLLIAADCTAYAYGNIHQIMKDKITLIGCPKLDDTDYAGKLTQILMNNDLNSITVLRMEVPCCGGIVHAVKTAMLNSGKLLPWRVVTISTDGLILEDRG